MREKRVLSERGYEVISQNTTYCVNKMKKPLSNSLIDFISKLFKETNSFKRVERNGEALNNLKNEKKYIHSVQ